MYVEYVIGLKEGIYMDVQVKEYMDKYPEEIVAMYACLRDLILDSVTCEPEEKLWAKLQAFMLQIILSG